MKVLFFIKNLALSGGTERMTATIANALSSEGYEVSIVSICGGGKSYFDLDDRVATYGLFGEHRVDIQHILFYPLILVKYHQKLKRIEPDMVVDVCRPMSVFSIPLRKLFRYKVITWEHFNHQVIFSVWSRWAQKIVMKYTDVLLCLTQEDRDEYLKKSPTTDVRYIHNPITIQSDQKSELKEKVVLSVGRFSLEKGQDLLVEAWAKIKDKRGWKLKIVGGGDPKWRAKIERQVVDLDLKDSVDLLPATPDVIPLYKNASIFVLPSRFEGLGLVLLEALYMGLPVVAFSAIPFIREQILSNDVGIVCEPEDVNSLAKALEKMICDDDFREVKSKNAVASVQGFQRASITPQWQKLLTSFDA